MNDHHGLQQQLKVSIAVAHRSENKRRVYLVLPNAILVVSLAHALRILQLSDTYECPASLAVSVYTLNAKRSTTKNTNSD
jgi:hypothetical protein